MMVADFSGSLSLLTHQLWSLNNPPPSWYGVAPLALTKSAPHLLVTIENQGGTLLYSGPTWLSYQGYDSQVNIAMTHRMQSWGPFRACDTCVTLPHGMMETPALFLASRTDLPAPLGAQVKVTQKDGATMIATVAGRLCHDLHHWQGLVITGHITPPSCGDLQIIWEGSYPLNAVVASYNALVPPRIAAPWRLRQQPNKTSADVFRNQVDTFHGILQPNFPVLQYGPYPLLVAEIVGSSTVVNQLRSMGWVIGTPFLLADSPSNKESMSHIVWILPKLSQPLLFPMEKTPEVNKEMRGAFVRSPRQHQAVWKQLRTSTHMILPIAGQLPVIGRFVDSPTPAVIVVDPDLYHTIQDKLDAWTSSIYGGDMTWVVAFRPLPTLRNIPRILQETSKLKEQVLHLEVKGWN